MEKFCLNCTKLLIKKQQKFCCIECQNDFRFQEYIREWLLGFQSGAKYEGEVSGHVRRWLHEKHNSKCQKCGWGEINPTTNKVPLTVNHINGDWNNHSPDNLELLCPNCHSLTSNFGSLNNGHGRTKRKADVLPLNYRPNSLHKT